MGRRQAAGAAQLRSIRRRWSAHRCRPLAAHRPLFLAVPEIDDEDRLGAGVIHPDDSPGGGSSGDSGTVGEGVSCRGAEGPAAWTRHQESLVVAGPAFPFCACFASGGWARLSGPARFSATEPVTGADQTSVDALTEGTRRASLLFRNSSRLLGRFLVVPADSVGWDVADGRTTHIWAVFEPPRNFGLDGELAPDSATHPSTRRQLRNRRLDGG
jgi:hypothetical protein